MAISSIHIEKGANGFFAHNSREKKTEKSIFNDEENFCSCLNAKAFEIYKSELEIRKAAYENRTNQKLQKSTITHFSAIVNLNKDHTEKDLKLVCDYLEKTLDTKVVQFAIHRDEGHHLNDATDEVRKMHALLNDDDKIKNYHAHIEFVGLDSNGASIRRKITKKYLSELQTKTAELLKMTRGVSSMIENQEDFYNQILDEMPKITETADVIADLNNFKKAFIATSKFIRYRDKPKAKRKSTNHYKTSKENEASTLALAKQKDLKAEIKALKQELINSKQASKEDYTELKTLENNLRAKIKAKDLTNKQLEDEILELKSKVLHPSICYKNTNTKVLYKDLYEDSSKKLSEALETILEQNTANDALEQENSVLKQSMNDLELKNKQKDLTIKQLEKQLSEALETLKSKNEQISTLKQRNSVLEQSMNDLELKNKRLEDEISLLKNKNNANLGFNQAIKNLLNQKIQELDEIKILLEDDDILNLHYMIDEIKSETQNIINTKQQSKAIKENYQEQEYSNPYEELENLVKKQRQ